MAQVFKTVKIVGSLLGLLVFPIFLNFAEESPEADAAVPPSSELSSSLASQ